MSFRETDRLFRNGVVDPVNIAGRELLGYLRQEGALPKNIGLHLQALAPDERAASFTCAIQAAVRGAYDEMPEWAQPGHALPSVIEIPYANSMNEQQVILDGLDVHYYSMISLVRTLRGDIEEPKWRKRAFTVSRMTWSRILRQVDPESRERLDYLDTFKSQAEADDSGIDLKRATLRTVTVKCIGDDLLYDMMSNNLIGLRSYTKGIGEIALLGVGAMLCIEGGHGDLYPYAERLADYVASTVEPPPEPATGLNEELVDNDIGE